MQRASLSGGFPEPTSLAALCCAAALVYPATISWESAWQRYHAWPDARSFVSALKPIEARSRAISICRDTRPTSPNITPAESLTGPGGTRHYHSILHSASNSWNSYYSETIAQRKIRSNSTFLLTTFSSSKVPGTNIANSSSRPDIPRAAGTSGRQLGRAGSTGAYPCPGKGREQYRIAAVGHYNTSNISGTHDYGIYAIWQRNSSREHPLCHRLARQQGSLAN